MLASNFRVTARLGLDQVPQHQVFDPAPADYIATRARLTSPAVGNIRTSRHGSPSPKTDVHGIR
jgi:hypothetical protein